MGWGDGVERKVGVEGGGGLQGFFSFQFTLSEVMPLLK